ncbi:MAG: hypothetical protein V4736_00950 [Bdellovibrionota bacterium]
MKINLLLLAALMFFTTPTYSAEGKAGTKRFDFRDKADRKWGSRWTLQEWLEQKDRNRMMDLWLSMNEPSPFEFFIGGTYQDYKLMDQTNNTEAPFTSGTGVIGAYATIVGLEGFYENNTKEKFNSSGGSINLRIMGNAVQATHLSLNYGYRSLTTEETGTEIVINQQFAGADLNIYLTKYFGISGAYRSYMPTTQETFGEVLGNRTEGGVFIDYSALRVFGSWYSEKQTTHILQIERITNRTGIMSGIKFFF